MNKRTDNSNEIEAPESTTADRHALVLGGSLAGLLAARVLCDHFDRVTVVERDPFLQPLRHAVASRRRITFTL